MTQAVERRLFDWLVRQGKIDDVRRLIDTYIANKNQGEGHESRTTHAHQWASGS
jgi:hypothetical protein